MSQKSKWVETSYDLPDGQELVLPLRCCVEVRKNRIRGLIQQLVGEEWVLVKKLPWAHSPNAHRVPLDKLDAAACEVADTIENMIDLDAAMERVAHEDAAKGTGGA